jgi:hypothetical protein
MWTPAAEAGLVWRAVQWVWGSTNRSLDGGAGRPLPCSVSTPRRRSHTPLSWWCRRWGRL